MLDPSQQEGRDTDHPLTPNPTTTPSPPPNASVQDTHSGKVQERVWAQGHCPQAPVTGSLLGPSRVCRVPGSQSKAAVPTKDPDHRD